MADTKANKATIQRHELKVPSYTNENLTARTINTEQQGKDYKRSYHEKTRVNKKNTRHLQTAKFGGKIRNEKDPSLANRWYLLLYSLMYTTPGLTSKPSHETRLDKQLRFKATTS
jgi:hypothetical protein